MDTIIPPQSWDTHVHVFDPERHPYVPNSYTPPARSTKDLVDAVPVSNFVIVMSGPEGTKTAQTGEAIEQLRQMGREARGVVIMDLEQMGPEELQRLDRAGVRSVRFNTERVGLSLDDFFKEAVDRIVAAGLKWSIEAAIFDVTVWHGLIPTMRSLHDQHGTIFVVDHIFAAQPSELGSPRFEQLLQLVEDGIQVVKISGLSRYGRQPEPMMPIVEEILKRRQGQGAVFGSDWPNVNAAPGSTDLMTVDIPGHLRILKELCDKLGGQTWEKLMRDNAARLYA